MEYDVVVVGAGPAGSMAAKYAAKAGASVLMIEEHETIGQPVQCAGLISAQAFEGCEVPPETVSRLGVRGANVHAPDGHVLKMDGRRTMAYVVDRGELDRAMALEALKSGAAALVKTRLNNFRRQQDRIIIAAQSQGDPIEIQTRVIIGADGLQSAVGRLAGLGRAKLVFTCAQAEIFAGAAQTDFVDLYVGRNVAPGFFAWGIPTGSGSVRIGLCSTERSSDLLGPLLERLSPHSAPTFLNFCAGGIPLGPPPCTVADGILLVGDAAGQVKATSGGGIYPGTLCAKIAGAVAAEAAAHTNTTREALMAYDRRWRSAIGRELETGLRIRTRLNALSDDDLNYMVRTLDDERTLDMISRYGDMDHPSVVLRKLLLSTKAPRLLKLIKPMIKFGVTRTAR